MAFSTRASFAADAPATPPSPPSEQEIAARWARDEPQYKAYLKQFGNAPGTAQLVVKLSQYARDAAWPQPVINSVRAASPSSALFHINAVTVTYTRVPHGSLLDFAAKLKADAPAVVIQELNTTPERIDPNLYDGNIRIVALELSPAASTPTSLTLKEYLFTQFQKFDLGSPDPFELLAKIDKLRPPEVEFGKTHFFDGNKISMSCSSIDPQAVSKCIDSLRNSGWVDVDLNKLQIITTLSRTTFQLNLTFKSAPKSPAGNAPKSGTQSPPPSPFLF